MPVESLTSRPPDAAWERVGRVYLRFTVADRPGVLAELTAAMRDAGVSIESLIQRGNTENGGVYLVMVTHEVPERAVTDALARLHGSENILGRPMLMRSEEHTSELQSLMRISYAVFCLKKKQTNTKQNTG